MRSSNERFISRLTARNGKGFFLQPNPKNKKRISRELSEREKVKKKRNCAIKSPNFFPNQFFGHPGLHPVFETKQTKKQTKKSHTLVLGCIGNPIDLSVRPSAV